MYPDVHAQVVQLGGNTSIREGRTLFHAIHIATDGVTKGDTVEVLDAPASGVGTTLFTYVAPADTDNYSFCPSTPVPCNSGLCAAITLAGGGAAYVTIVYS